MARARTRRGDGTDMLLAARRLPAVCVIAVLCLGSASSAQGPAGAPSSPLAAAAAAFNTGRYDDIDGLLRDASDPRAVVLRGRALAARGRYPDAQALLRTVAAAAPGSDAALELGLLESYLGRREDARRRLDGVLRSSPSGSAADLVRLGRAARALGRYQEANGYFRDAVARAPEDPAANAGWGELFLEKYQYADAVQSFQAALKAAPDDVPARIGMARAVMQQNPPQARQAVDAALKVNPRDVAGHVLAAELALDDRRRDDARASIGQALAVNPNSLEARALDAAMALLEGRLPEFESKAKAILELNPVYGDAYRVAGDHLARNYRFDEAVDLTRRALQVDPQSTRAHADLGLHLLRTGDEPAARTALETSFKADPFDVVTYNLLEMMDSLDTFETIRDGDIVLRLHPQEAAVMREFALPLAKEALATLSKQYQFQVRAPILVEMFPKHDDFAVRTLGLPGMIGALGACFGRVVTLDSPKARPPGQFSWVGTLWHEMAHVITLQMSNNRLPRWLSEGISQFEERRYRAEWGREMEVQFAQALADGKTLKLRDLNEGFSDPRMISLSYYQASLVVEHVIAEHGEPALRDLIRAYGRGLENEAAIEAALGVTIDQLQASFDARIGRQFAPVRAALQAPEMPKEPSLAQLQALAVSHPGSFRVQMQLAQALRMAGDAVAAIQALERAARLLPQATGEANPHAGIAAIALERGDTARAIEALQAQLRVDYADVETARQLAALLEKDGGPARALPAYQLVAELDPFDAQAQGHVGRAALQRRDAGRAVPALRAALAANPPDRAGAHTDLAEAYLLAGRLDDAKQQALAALEIAPTFDRAQDLLLRIVDAPGGAD